MMTRNAAIGSLNRRRAGLLVPVIALLVAILVYGCESQTPQSPAAPGETGQLASAEPTTAPSNSGSDRIAVFFSTPSRGKEAINQPSALRDAVIDDIAAAKSKVVVAVFDLDLSDIADALIAAKKRGLDVRAVVDSENLETPEVSEVTGRLNKAKVKVQFDNREAFMHNKFFVIDDKLVWTGSWNVTVNDTFYNNNNMVRLVSDVLAREYAQEFEQMFAGKFGKKKRANTARPTVTLGTVRVTPWFSPEDGVAKHVVAAIDNAKSSVRFMAFSYTSKSIADAMIAADRRGVEVKGIVERQNASSNGAQFPRLKKAGLDVMQDGNCRILHHKTIIIDDAIVITGSYNFTASAEQDNDENLVIIEDATIAQRYLEEFQRVYTLAQSPQRCGN